MRQPGNGCWLSMSRALTLMVPGALNIRVRTLAFCNMSLRQARTLVLLRHSLRASSGPWSMRSVLTFRRPPG